MKKATLFTLLTIFYLTVSSSVNYNNLLKNRFNKKNEKLQNNLNTSDFPAYRNILTKFFNTYSVKNRPNRLSIEQEIIFHKKPDGWHIIVLDYYAKNKIVKDELFWDKKSRSYKELSFDKISNSFENAKYIKYYEISYHFRFYDICPFYGYNGWDIDVIDTFKGFNFKSDTLIYAVGRAYSVHASNLLNNNSGLADSSSMFNLPDTLNCMNPEQLKKYRFYRHKAIEYFDTLALRNPNFNTIVGPIRIKASNERLVSYLDLLIYQNKEEAKKELEKDLYDPFTIAAAKNYLNSCEDNAVLFTYGDNDTYPLLYVQEVLGVKTNVLVVNIQLLNTYRYINSFRGNKEEVNNLPLSFKKEDFAENKRLYILIKKISNKHEDLEELIASVKDDSNGEFLGKERVYYFSTNLFRMKVNETDTMFWKSSKNYILRNKLIILDVIQKNKLKRPIYFTISTDKEVLDGLSEFLLCEGLVNKLIYKKQSDKNYLNGHIKPDHLMHILFEVYDWNGTDKRIMRRNMYASLYRSLFLSLAENYISKDNYTNAEIVWNKSVELFPDTIYKYGIEMYSYIEYCYKNDKFKKANVAAKALIKNLKEEKNTYIKEKEMQLLMLKELIEKYEQTDLLNLF